jgi:hypothetical protein
MEAQMLAHHRRLPPPLPNAAYLVLSFVGLVVLLLLSAYACQHLTPGGGGVKRSLG